MNFQQEFSQPECANKIKYYTIILKFSRKKFEVLIWAYCVLFWPKFQPMEISEKITHTLPSQNLQEKLR